MKIMLPNGYAGPMGYASAACMADFIMVNMVAEAVSGHRRRRRRRCERARKARGARYDRLLIIPVRSDAGTSVVLSRFNNRHFLGLLFMLPAAVLLLVFLTYPLGLGTWLGFTDTKVGRAGRMGRPRQLRVPGAATRSRGSRSSTRSSTPSSRASSSSCSACGWRCCSTPHAVQVVHPRHRAAAVHRAHGALGDRLLVDLRRAVLGDLAGC